MKRKAFPDAPSLEVDDPNLMREDPPVDLIDYDPYYVGLSQAQIDSIEDGSLSVVDHMLMDCARGYTVIIGFCERQQENNAQMLRSFIQEHPEFAFLIQPILEYDPETASAGEIFFQRNIDRVMALIKLTPIYVNQQRKEIQTELSPDLFKRFVELTEPFGCHMANNGEYPLNF